MPYTPEQARALALQLGPLYGLREDQLPTSVFADVLNGLEQCEAILEAIPQVETPVPAVKLVPVPTVEPGGGWRP
ncbi:MAG: hypothetical protein AB7V42_03010 [Thermoleophilia bacterium]